MGGIVSSVTDAIGLTDSKSGKKAADSSLEAAQIAADAQREALDYLKQQEALPTEIRDKALQSGMISNLLDGGQLYQRPDQAALVQQAQSSPLYSAIMGGQQAGEEAILRNQAATGGLRSGNTSAALADYNTNLQNQALLQSYNQALAEQQYGNQLLGSEFSSLMGLAGMPSNANAIANMTAGIGQTLSQGEIAAAQARQAGSQQQSGNLMGLANLGIQAYGAGMFSDRRLKENIRQQGVRNGHNWYSWTWNEEANKLGLTGQSEGVIADEVYKTNPEAIEFQDGYAKVNYGALGL